MCKFTLNTSNYGAECITDLIPQRLPAINKTSCYTSKYRGEIKSEMKRERFLAKTMGKPLTNPPDARKYLKRDQGHVAVRLKVAYSKKNTSPRSIAKKPKVPRIKDLKIPSQPKFVDKIKENAIRNISSIPSFPKKVYVDSPNGHKNDLLTSGLVPRYRNKNTYGIVPDYIKRRKAHVEKTDRLYHEFAVNQQRNDSLSKMSCQERSDILNSLKDQWASLHHAYQGLSVLTDTAPKKNRKEKLENRMGEIQKDIEYLERNEVIYIEK